MLVLKGVIKNTPISPIIKREDYTVLKNAEKIIEDAKEKRQRLLEQTDAQIDLLKVDAQKEIEEMHKKSEQECAKECEQKRLEMLFNMLSSGIKYFSNIEDTFVQTLRSLFLKIWGEVPAEERMLKVVKTTVKTLPNGKFLQISVNQEQIGLLKQKVKELQACLPSLERIEIVASKSLAVDECILETETGILEAGLTVQLDVLMKAINSMLH